MQDVIDPVDTPDGQFHDGNPADGTIGTLVKSLWLNNVQGATRSMQSEIRTVLQQAGIALDPAKTDQLLDAIKKISSSATTPPANDNSTKIATTEWFKAEQATETVQGTAKVATQALVDAGVDDKTVITPKKLYAWAKQATEALFGVAKVATQAQTNAGTDDATIVTPKKLRAGFSTSFGTNGFVVFPSWLGSFIIQWGVVNATAVNGNVTASPFPMRFPSACYIVVGNRIASGSNAQMNVYSAGGDPSGQVIFQNWAASAELGSYIAFGK